MFLGVRFKAMAKDSLNSSHPVSVSSQVTTPEQVSEMFDSVTYEKVQSRALLTNVLKS